VNLKTRTIHIRPEITKTDEGLDVPIDHETATLLEKLKAGATSLRVLDLPHRTAIRTALLAAAKRSGIRPLRVHDLRTSFISRARRAGIPLEVTAKLAGHSDARTTLRFYRGLEEAELRAAVEKLGGDGKGSRRKGARQAVASRRIEKKTDPMLEEVTKLRAAVQDIASPGQAYCRTSRVISRDFPSREKTPETAPPFATTPLGRVPGEEG